MNFPLSLRVGRLSLLVSRMAPAHVPIIHNLFRKHWERQHGVANDNDTPDQLLCRINNRGHISLSIFEGVEKQHSSPIGAVLIYPSRLCRSAEPVNNSGFVVVDPEFCGRGIGTKLIHISHQAAWSAGYLDSTTRMTTKEPRIYDKAGKEIIGEIPYSIYSRGKGRLADYLTFHTESMSHEDEHERRRIAIDNKRNKPVPDVLTPEAEVPPWAFTDVVVKSEKVRIPGYAEPCLIRAGTLKDVYAIDTMLRLAADKGNGFALDEFTPDGFFNRKFLRQCHNLVLCSPDGVVLGAALFGPSAICQSITTPVLHFYIVVSKAGKCRGVGKNLMDAVLTFASKNSYLAVFGDAFDMDVRATQFLIRNGFKKTCSLPNCAYVKNVGLAAGSLYSKDVNSLYRDCIQANIHET